MRVLRLAAAGLLLASSPALADPAPAAPPDADQVQAIAQHLFDVGKAGPTPAGKPGRCLLHDRWPGKEGEVVLACVETTPVLYPGKLAPAVQQFLLGDVVVMHEDWHHVEGDLFMVEQFILEVSESGKLTDVAHNILLIHETGHKLEAVVPRKESPADPAILKIWNDLAPKLLTMQPEIRA